MYFTNVYSRRLWESDKAEGQEERTTQLPLFGLHNACAARVLKLPFFLGNYSSICRALCVYISPVCQSKRYMLVSLKYPCSRILSSDWLSVFPSSIVLLCLRLFVILSTYLYCLSIDLSYLDSLCVLIIIIIITVLLTMINRKTLAYLLLYADLPVRKTRII